MFELQDIFPQLLVWLALFISIILAFMPYKLWPIGLGITVLLAIVIKVLVFESVLILGNLFLCAWLASRTKNPEIKALLTIVVGFGCIALAAHLFPGFNNILALNEVFKSEQSSALTFYLNIDKPMVLFALLLMIPSILATKVKAQYASELNNGQIILLTIIAFTVIFSLAMSLSLIKFDLGLPNGWLIFALNNLLITCVIEEVFFRGFILFQLEQGFKKYSLGRFFSQNNTVIALVLSSILFGLAHFAGGVEYIFVATLAGILYGFIYQSTGKIIWAVLVRFLVNFMHLSLFTYPLYQPL